MNKNMQSTLLAAALLATVGSAHGADAVDKSFFPYRGGAPSLGKFKPGSVINRNNVEVKQR